MNCLTCLIIIAAIMLTIFMLSQKDNSFKSLSLYRVMYKKLLFVVIISAAWSAVTAQKITYAVKGGINFSSGKVEVSNRKYSGGGIGFHLGGIADVQLNNQLSLQPHLLISHKKASLDDLGGIDIGLTAIEVPVTLLYHYKGFFGGLGPNFSYGISGKYNYEGEKYDLYDKSNDGRFSIKHFEIGLNILAGYALESGLFFSANFTPGLNNIFNNSAYAGSGTKVHTSVFGVSVGYMLTR